MIKRHRSIGVVTAVAVSGVTLFASLAPAVSASQSSRAQSAKSQFNALVSEAKASNHEVAFPYGSAPAAEIAADVQGFEHTFGFPVAIQNVPGNTSLDIPQKVLAAAPSGKGVVDEVGAGDLWYELKVFGDGYFRKPNWAALYYKWPNMSTYRGLVQPNLKATVKGKVIHAIDYSVVTQDAPYAIIYNTKYVTAAQMKNATWQTLLSPTFKGRVAIDETGGTMGYYGLAVGEAKMKSFIQGLESNAVIPVSGGSAGVANAVVSGQAWIGLSSYAEIATEDSVGAPIAGVIPRISPTDHRVAMNVDASWLLQPGVNDPAMAELFWGWYVNQGIRVNAPWGSSRLDPKEEGVFPLAGTLKADGITPAEYVVPHTLGQATLFNGLITTAGELLTGTA